MFMLSLAVPAFLGLFLSQAAHSAKEINLTLRDTTVVDGSTYVLHGENFGGTYTVAIGKPGSMWFYSFPEQEVGKALNPAKVTTHEGNVYQSLVTDAGHVVLKLLDEKAAPTPLPASYLILGKGDAQVFKVNAVEYRMETSGHSLGGGDSLMYASIYLDGKGTGLELELNTPLRYKDLTLTCRFIHAEWGGGKHGYIVEYKYTPGAAILPVSRSGLSVRKLKGGYDALGRSSARSFAGRPGGTHFAPR